MTPGIAYYITAHGFGHGVRSCDIIRAFARQHPDVPFRLVTDLPEPFLRNRLPDAAFSVRPAVFDVGMVQWDSVRVDVARTLDAALVLQQQRPELIAGEMAFLRQFQAGCVVCDIPSIPLEAAAALGIPAIGVGNFTWNWIYSAFSEQDQRWRDVIALFEEGYGQADALLRLPFAEPMSAFSRIIDVPVLAEPGTANRERLAALTGAPRDKRWVLLSFSTLDWDQQALDRVEALEDYVFFTVRPLEWSRRNIFPVNREDMLFSDILASAEAVITKPGFGVVSECVVNRKPMLYVDRTDFLEYTILEQAVRRYLQHQHIPANDLYRGNLGPYLAELWRQPQPVDAPAVGGAPVAAEHLARFLQG